MRPALGGIEMSSENHDVLISVVIDKLRPSLQRHFPVKVEIGANFLQQHAVLQCLVPALDPREPEHRGSVQ